MTTLAPAKVTFERILVPTDFSDICHRAVSYAKCIARESHSHLFLLHVNEPINAPPEAVWINGECIQRALDEQLEQSSAELRSEGFHAEALSVTGIIQDEVIAVIKLNKVDLIVMGTHARLGLDRFFFGSDAEAVSRHVQCPVLLIGPAVPFNQELLWPPKHVLCATTLNPDSAWIAAYAFQLAHEHGAEFLMANVEDPVNWGRCEDWTRFENAFKESLPAGASSSDSLHCLFGNIPGYRIVDLAKERHSDLIIMGARTASTIATHLLRGTLPQVFAGAPCPVMTLQQK